MSATITDINARELKAKSECQTLKDTLKDKENKVADISREQEEKIYKLRSEVCIKCG